MQHVQYDMRPSKQSQKAVQGSLVGEWKRNGHLLMLQLEQRGGVRRELAAPQSALRRGYRRQLQAPDDLLAALSQLREQLHTRCHALIFAGWVRRLYTRSRTPQVGRLLETQWMMMGRRSEQRKRCLQQTIQANRTRFDGRHSSASMAAAGPSVTIRTLGRSGAPPAPGLSAPSRCKARTSHTQCDQIVKVQRSVAQRASLLSHLRLTSFGSGSR